MSSVFMNELSKKLNEWRNCRTEDEQWDEIRDIFDELSDSDLMAIIEYVAD